MKKIHLPFSVIQDRSCYELTHLYNITREEAERIKAYFKELDEQTLDGYDEEDYKVEEWVGHNIIQVTESICGDDSDFFDEHLQHVVVGLTGDKYDPEY